MLIEGCYEHIDHTRLLGQLEWLIPEKDVMRLLTQVIGRTVEWGGSVREVRGGIGRGSPLSPLFGALYLKPLDDALDRAGLHFVRYMDDILVLAPTCWRLRRAIARVNRVLNELGLSKHPGKTWMGPIDRSVDFLGYRHTWGNSCQKCHEIAR